MSKKSRGKKGEASVRKALEGLEGEHYVLNDVTFLDDKDEMSHQVDHVLIHPHGVFVVETKTYFGKMEITDEGKWNKTVRGETVRVHNPWYQNQTHARVIRKILGSDFSVVPVVVFAKNNAPYTGDDNVINLKDLPLFVEAYPYPALLTSAQMKDAQKKLRSASVRMSQKEHLENIGYLKELRKTKQAEITVALEQGVCPWCGERIKNEGFHYYCPSCKFEFTL